MFSDHGVAAWFCPTSRKHVVRFISLVVWGMSCIVPTHAADDVLPVAPPVDVPAPQLLHDDCPVEA